MKRPLFQLILIQFKEYYREPGIIFWSIIFPILIAWGLGIAFTNKGELIKNIAVVENSAAPVPVLRNFLKDAKKEVVRRDDQSEINLEKRVDEGKLGTIRYNFMITNWDNAILLLKRGVVPLIIEEKDGKLEYHFDPMNTDAQLTYLQVSGAITNSRLVENPADIIPLTKKGTRYIDFLIPGLIAMGLMMSTMWGISYSLIEKRAKKLLRRMLATPMKKSSFLISQFLARIVLTTMEAFLLYLFAHYYFGITIEGSLVGLALIFFAGMIAFTGIAIFVSARTSKTEIGNGLINAVVMPMMILSGIFFSYHNFPKAVIPIIQVLPLTMLADGIRSIFIEGAGLHELAVEIVTLSGVGIVFFLAGLRIYRWY
ncbi:MAG: ABC transporter permease [Calditrichia bacterium]